MLDGHNFLYPPRSKVAQLTSCRSTRILIAAISATVLAGCGSGNQPRTADPLNATFSASEDVARSCVATVRKLKVSDQVAADAARGETRYFFVDGEERMFRYAPGISSCSPRNRNVDSRTIRIAGFEPPNDRTQEVEEECDFAIANYVTEYNRSMATSFPKSLRQNCDRVQAAVDNTYPLFDFDKYYERLAAAKKQHAAKTGSASPIP